MFILIGVLSACQLADKSPILPAKESLFSKAIEPVNYQLQRFAVDRAGQAYGVNGKTLFEINSLNDKITPKYHFSDSIVGFHISVDDSFVISTDNDHWSADAPCRLYESVDQGNHFSLIKVIEGGCPLWLSIDSDRQGNLYVGEYGPKEPGVSKSVWKREVSTDQWQIIFQAKLNSDAHVHRVAVDPITDYLWISVGDTKKNRGIYYSKNRGISWSKVLDSQATGVAFTKENIYWGEDKKGYGGIIITDHYGLNKVEGFNAAKKGNYVGRIYELLALPNGGILAPIMKYADETNVASLWYGINQQWLPLIQFESLPGHSNDVSSIAGPDKNGYVLISGFKLKLSLLPGLD